jgi:hypothetical protein
VAEELRRGANGGAARALKLSKEQRSAIAKAAAAKRWAKKDKAVKEVKRIDVGGWDDPLGEIVVDLTPETNAINITPDDLSTEKHCPACLAGESLEEGEGTHILATVEHPVTLPAAFQDAEATVILPTPPAPPQKPPKRQSKPMPKELKTASSYAEKRLPQAIKEKADLLVEVARREAEIQELTRVIQALGGQSPVGIPSGPTYPNPAYQTPQQPYQLPAPYPEYNQPAPVVPVVTPMKPMKAGGAGVAMGIPDAWLEG